MLHGILFAVAMLISLCGCVVLFLDALVTRRTDRCQVETSAEFVGEKYGSLIPGKQTGFFVLAIPELSYTYKGKKYQGKSANLFFHLYLRKGKLSVPFVNGKRYYVYVDPSNPAMFISSGEQRVAFMHVFGCAIVVVGAVMLLGVMGMPA